MGLKFRHLATAALLLSIVELGVIQAQWRPRTPMPTARYGLCSAVLDDKVYVIGGATTMQNMQMRPLRTVEVYDPKTDAWDTNAPSLNEPRVFAAAVEFDDKIYVFGGQSRHEGGYLSSVEMYDPARNKWIRRAPMPTPRAGLAVTVLDGKIYAIGGANANGILKTVERYDPEHDQWETNLPQLNRPRWGFSAFTFNDAIIVIGGLNSTGPLPFIEKYESGSQWRELNLRLFFPRGFYGSAATENSLFIIGGTAQLGSIAFVEIFNLHENRLIDARSFALTYAREKFTCAVVDNRIYAFGGVSSLFGQQQPLESNEERDVVTAVTENTPTVPSKVSLHQNYPNPFSAKGGSAYGGNPSTTIVFDLPQRSFVKLVVYDLLGREVKTLVDEEKAPGRYEVKFSAAELPSGVYFYRLTAGEFSAVRKMTLMR
ncbi:MAG: Kelch repeat-containing protein [Bacteroidota bacterium]